MSIVKYCFDRCALLSFSCILLFLQLRSIEKLEDPTEDEELPVTGLSSFMIVLKKGIQDRLTNSQAITWKIATFLNPR